MLFRWLILAAVCVYSLLPAQDWREFRGPNRAGIASTAVRLPSEINAGNADWSAPAPMGRSSPIISGQRLLLTAANDREFLVISYDTRSGKENWRYSLPRARHGEIDANRNDAASPTPVTDGRAVFAFFPDFGLAAISMDGKLLWKLPLPAFVNNYGMASSPVLFGGTVYLQCDQTRDSFLIAVDAKTGRMRWRKDRAGAQEGWATPVIVEKSGLILALSSNGLEALDCETGQPRWSVPAGGGLMIPSPILDGDSVIVTFRGSDQPTFPSWESLLGVDGDSDGKISQPEAAKRFPAASFGIADPDRDGFITQAEWNAFRNRGVGGFGFVRVSLRDQKAVWRYTRGLPYVPSPLFYGNVLYSIRSGGVLTALDAGTGRLLKEGRWPEGVGDYFASPIAAEGKLYLASAEGKVSVVRAGGDWEVVRVNDFHEPISATPAVADGALFVRTHSRLFCFRAR